jgi:PAS domain S-box-containing protein
MKKSYQQLENELADLRKQLADAADAVVPADVILQTMNDGFVLADSKGRILKVNDAYCRMTGFNAAELVGSNIVEREALLTPEEVGHKIEWMLQTGHARFETEHIHKSGRRIPLLVSFSVVHRKDDFQVAAFVEDNSHKYPSSGNKTLMENTRLFPEALDGVALISKKGFVLDVNPAFVKITGIPREELVNKKAFFLIKKFLKFKQIPEISLQLSNLLAGKPIGRLYLDYRNQILEVSLADMSWGGGITIIVRDVTREQKALHALHESELKFRKAFKNSSDALVITRLSDSKIVEINDGFTELTGYSWSEVIGKTTDDIRLWVNKAEQLKGVEELTKTGRIRKLEAVFRIKNGQKVHGLFSADRMDIHGEPHLISITRTLEDIKRVEENLNLAQELGNIGSWELDWTTRKLSWSDQLYRIFEIDHSVAPDYGLFQQYIHPEDLEQARQVLRDSIRNHTAYELQHRLRLPHGKIKWVLETGRTLYDDKGKPLRSVGAVQDITEKKLAEDDLKKSQRLFQSLAASSPVGIFRTDAEGNTTYVNPKWCQMSGMSRTKALGDGWLEGVHPDDRSGLLLAWKQTASRKEISVSHYRFLHPDGQVIYVKGQAVPEYDANNHVSGYVGTITDITEQVKARKVLEKAHHDLVQTLENMTDGFTSVDKNWNYLYVNKRAGEIFGMNPADLIGKNVWEVFPEMVGGEFYKQSLKAMKTGVPVVFENYYAPDEQWFENRLVPTKEGMSTFFQDITPRKLANDQLREQEALLSAIMRNYPNAAVSVLNKNFEIEFIGGSLLMNHEVDVTSMKGRNHKDILKQYTQKHIESIEKVYQKVFGGEEMEYSFSLGGNYFHMTALPLYFEKEHVTKILSIVEDITQQKMIEKELKALNENLEMKVKQRTEKLEKSEKAMLLLLEDMKETQQRLVLSNDRLHEVNQELESFSYSVSHDLKAPLRAVHGFGSFLKETHYDLLDEEGKKLLDDIIKNAEGMSRLIEGLLELSRTGRKQVKRSTFDLEPVALSIFSEQKKYHDLPQAKLQLADDLPQISADYILMKQLLANLFSNALKYSAKQKIPTVKLGWMIHDNKTIFFVQDNGVGFDMRYASKMFDPFQRLHSRAMYEGTGIGLSIVKRIVSKHGGDIWAEGAVDKGATIYFSLQEND